MMPFIALLSTILIGWIVTPDYVIDEMERNGEKFHRKKTLLRDDPFCRSGYDVHPVPAVYRNFIVIIKQKMHKIRAVHF